MPAAAALQSSPALRPVVAEVLASWQKHKRAAMRAAAAEGMEADELAELEEQLETLLEAYTDPDAAPPPSEDEGSDDSASLQ